MSTIDWTNVLQDIAPKWRDEFKNYISTGKSSEEFRNYIDTDPAVGKVLDKVLDIMMAGICKPDTAPSESQNHTCRS